MPNPTESAVQPGKTAFHSMPREQLLLALEMFAKNWLAHDGCWFLAAEESLGMDAAIELDTSAWQRFAATEANRIMTTFSIPLCRRLGGAGKRFGLAAVQPDQLAADRVVGRRQTPAALHGCLPGAGNPPAQRASGFPLQARRHRGVRDFRAHRGPSYSHEVSALPAGISGRQILRLGIQPVMVLGRST